MRIGIIANPESGKDIRRLTTGASISTSHEKSAIIRRFIAAVVEIREAEFHYLPDSDRITESALNQLRIPGHKLDVPIEGSWRDSQLAANALRGVDLVVSLGGDGTNRAIAMGWIDVPLIALATGTNNAFASLVEATTAGVAAALIAGGDLPNDTISVRSKTINVTIGTENAGLALVDVVGTKDRFLGARAIIDPSQYVFAVLTQADAIKVGMVGVAGTCDFVSNKDPVGLALTFNTDVAESRTVKAVVSPGLLRDVCVGEVRRIGIEESFTFRGPLVLAYDGEREQYVSADQTVRCVLKQNGPQLFDVNAAMRTAAQFGLLQGHHTRVLANA